MNVSLDFPTFLVQFFELFSNKSFRGNDYLEYLCRPDSQRSGDEASVVDTAIVSPLLGLLGFAPAERVYNLARLNGRPDFAPEDAVLGTCFMVEDKSTSLQLTLDLSNPESHLSQLVGYMRSKGVRLGWLTNGKRFMVWRFNDGNIPTCIFELDIPTAIDEWRRTTPPSLSEQNEQALHTLFDLCHKASFTDGERLEREVATTLEVWQQLALPLGTGSGNETTLVESLQGLVQDLQRDARRMLDTHLQRYTEYSEKIYRLTDSAPEPATQQLSTLRERILSIITDTFQLVWNLEAEDIAAIENVLLTLAQDARAFLNPKEVAQRILTLVNEARQRKQNVKGKTVRPLHTLDEFTAFSERLQDYIDKAFSWHQRQALLRHDYRSDLSFYDDYTAWRSLVQETMLGTLDEEKRRDEFALQAAYVVFIRLLLIRVCEDKGVFQHRFLSDGGLKHWQEDIERYFVFTNGNPYAHLLDIAYENAQNIYAHFFTGRELFNWYTLDRRRFILTLYQLSRFNFAEVDSDLIGTIYNTYVNRAEKRNKGQYYTPQEIVDYILDNVGYQGANVIGSNKRLIDPACGSGAFLVTAAKRLIAAYKGTREQVDDPVAVLQRVQQNLFGFDLNPFACYLAEINLLIQVLDLVKQTVASGRPLKLERFNIYNVDALARPSGVYYFMNLNTLQAEENDQVNKIKSRALDTPYAQGFAFVVANPPYGAALSDTYKKTLRENWSDVFYGQPDTYTFFLKLGLDLLSNNGKLGYITPNTYLMGTHTAVLRNKLLTSGRIEQIVDLPQGIWNDANVDCVLLFLTAEKDEAKRRAQQVQIYALELRDALDKLTARMWTETLQQEQARWLNDAQHKMNIRYDALLLHIEEACRITLKDGSTIKVQRLSDVTESTQGIIPYNSRAEGQANLYIKTRRHVPVNENDWKPLLDGSGFVGRYELRWGIEQPYLKYGKLALVCSHIKIFRFTQTAHARYA